MRIQASKVGSSINLYLLGDNAQETLECVNQLFNFNIIAKIPDDFNEGYDYQVTLQTTKGKLIKGIIALCTVQLQRQADKVGRYNERALIMAANFIRQNITFTKSFYENGNLYSEKVKPYAIGNMDFCNATDSPHA